jgi:hypothetical protein
MDQLDRDNLLVLTVFGGSVVAFIASYLFAWRSKQTTYRKAGSLIAAAFAGFAGVFIAIWLIGTAMPFPPPDGSSIWGPLIFLLIFSPLPVGAFYICAKFIRQVYKDDRNFRL